MINFLILNIPLLVISVLFDIIYGEPPLFMHPVILLGKIISHLNPLYRNIGNKKIGGFLFLISIILLYSLPVSIVLFFLYSFHNYISLIMFIILSVFLLKSTFSINSMKKHIKEIIKNLENNDIVAARKSTSMVVRRNTSEMDLNLLSSASVETIAEGFVDGYFTPLFYYSFFGITGALAVKAINTMDSTVAYKDRENIDFGYFTALADTIINYIPSRLTPYIFSISAFFLGYNYKIKKLINTTDSFNGGYSMGAIARVLNVRLEKPGEYIINETGKNPDINDIKKALKIYYISSFFVFLITVLIILIILALLN